MTIAELRQALAENNGCAGTCPLSTSIFVRMSAQAALEDMAEGKTNAQITPFWRVISSLDKISKKLDIDPAWIDQQRSLEGEQ